MTRQTYLHQLLGRIAFVLYVDPVNQEFLEARGMINRMIDAYWRDNFISIRPVTNF